jgi:RimJ/RimL family protein N-acetyltransferase
MMKTMYQCLEKQKFTRESLSLVPIRWEDRYNIMHWRNEQMYHLRQDKPLTKEDQDAYFDNTVSNLFDQEQPKQILFSFLKEETCIGYGGLVHIDWKLKSAEISFVIDTELEKTEFSKLWLSYLSMIQRIAFHEKKLYKIYVYAYDLRPNLYPILIKSGFTFEKRIRNKIIHNDQWVDAIIHSKYNSNEAS